MFDLGTYNGHKKKACLFLLIGTTWITLICGIAALTLIWPGIMTRWKQTPAPPEALRRLDLGEAGEVLAVASNGTLYEFRYDARQTSSAWSKVTQPSGSPVIGTNCSPQGGRYLILPPPGKIMSHIGENCTYMESGYHFEVVLLENGEVWTWKHERYAYAELLCMFGLPIVFMFGLPFLTIGLILKIKQKAK